MIASAAATVAPPAKTAKRAKQRCSASLSSSWLQSIVARSVCWRAGASRRRARRAERCVQALGDLAWGQQPAAGGRQLDRQRQPVDAPADLRDGRGVAVAELEVRIVRSRALGEQRDRLDACQRLRVLDRRAVGQRERRDRVALLGLQRERLAAGGEHGQRGTGTQQAADERSGGEHVLEVVGDQQQVLGGEEAFGGLVGGLAREDDDPERSDDRRRHVLRSLHGGERHEVRAVGEVRLDGARGLERESRLADPARPGECEQPRGVRPQPLPDRGELASSADQLIGRRR